FRDRGVQVKVVMYPLYRTAYRSYDPAEVRRFLDRLTDITDFYDFTYTRLSEEPRYFYDTGHYRNEVGDMMIRKMFGVEGYVPEDFGIYVEKGSAYSIAEPDSEQTVPVQANYERKIKVLILHHVDDEATNSAVITEARLRELFDTIARKGYRVVRMTDIEAFVKHGVELPEKSVLLTFDDGYLSNYTAVYPLLKEYGYSAAFFPIGVSIGKDEYKDTGAPIIPHYSIEQMKEMKDSGLVEFGTHGFDVHQSAKWEPGRARVSLLKWEDESEADYIEFLKSDFKRFEQAVAPLELEIRAMAYPLGEHDVLSDAIAVEQGIELSFTTRHGDTSLLKGLYQSMFNMNRINIDMTVDLDWVLD
ncbi:MAG: polysaccharide deacetylase family protein, partial [Bacillota bacterium]|nr:polysaccharide deacetylase family protein [Bacillota bacterium]